MRKRITDKKFSIKSVKLAKLAVLLCVMAVLGCFALQKEGYHMDELLSFQLSNAEFNPWIVSTQPVGRLAKFVQEELRGDSFGETVSNLADTLLDVAANRGQSKLLQYKADVYPEPVWISRQQFRDYLVTDGADRFQYASVYFNVKDDNHPPLHFMLLHTMSSLFPGVVSPLLGCVVNLAAVAVCILCFFRLGNLLETWRLLPEGDGDRAGVCMGLLYGLSSGAIATVLLIRMYGVMTCFCVLLFYLHVKKWLEKGFENKNGRVAAVMVLGFLTQYFFLFYCVALAGVTVWLLVAGKRYRELRGYLRTIVLSGVVGVALFPFAIQDVLSSGRGVEALENLGRGFSGFGERLSAFGSILLKACFGSVFLGSLIGVCGAAGLVLVWVKKRNRVSERATDVSCSRFWLLLLLPCCFYFLLASRMSPYLVDRYIMPLFPFAAIVLTLVSFYVFRSFFPVVSLPQSGGHFRTGGWADARFVWVLLPVLLLGASNVAGYGGEYLYQGYEKQLEAAREYGELPCICLYDGQGFYYNLMEFMEYEETLLLRLQELEERENGEDIAGLRQVVVLRKGNVDEARVLEALRGYGLEVEAVLLEENGSVYGDTLYLCGRAGG